MEVEQIRVWRGPSEKILREGARSKAEFIQAHSRLLKHRLPKFHTRQYSVYLDQPDTSLVEVFPREVDSEIRVVTKAIDSRFHLVLLTIQEPGQQGYWDFVVDVARAKRLSLYDVTSLKPPGALPDILAAAKRNIQLRHPNCGQLRLLELKLSDIRNTEFGFGFPLTIEEEKPFWIYRVELIDSENTYSSFICLDGKPLNRRRRP